MTPEPASSDTPKPPPKGAHEIPKIPDSLTEEPETFPVPKGQSVSEMLTSALPEPPGTQKRDQIPEISHPIPMEHHQVEKSPQKSPSKGSKLLPVIGGILGMLLIILLLLKPSSPTKQETPSDTVNQLELQKELQTLKLKDQDINTQLATLTTRVKAAEEKVEAYQTALDALKQSTEEVQKRSSENRNYISTIYRQFLDLELKINAIGGGYRDNSNKEPESRVVNPYIGTSELP